jgi:hypothetical protein
MRRPPKKHLPSGPCPPRPLIFRMRTPPAAAKKLSRDDPETAARAAWLTARGVISTSDKDEWDRHVAEFDRWWKTRVAWYAGLAEGT